MSYNVTFLVACIIPNYLLIIDSTVYVTGLYRALTNRILLLKSSDHKDKIRFDRTRCKRVTYTVESFIYRKSAEFII
jgi:hypothetical protein